MSKITIAKREWSKRLKDGFVGLEVFCVTHSYIKILSGERAAYGGAANPKQITSPPPSREGGWGVGFINKLKNFYGIL